MHNHSEGNDIDPIGALPALRTDYNFTGQVSSIDDLPIYTVGEVKASNQAIIFIYDIYGFDGGRTREMCD